MKSIYTLILAFLVGNAVIAQTKINKADGGSVVTKLGLGKKVNDGSTLHREWYTINDAKCPMQLSGVGVNVFFNGSDYSFVNAGNFIPKEQILAFEVHHILYNMFGEHFKTLSNFSVKDISVQLPFERVTWYASESQVSEYLICVSYVANVRTANGTIWHCNIDEIKAQLQTIKLSIGKQYESSVDEK